MPAMAPEDDSEAQSEAQALLYKAEFQLKEGQAHAALGTLQNIDKLFPNTKGVQEALAVAKVMSAVQAGVKKGCECRERLQDDVACDWYAVLRVDPEADDVAIKRKFRQYALHCHPDKNSSSCAGEAFKWVSEAYAILSDPVRRAMFNKQRALLAAPCIDCILKKTSLAEKYRRSASIVSQARDSQERSEKGSGFGEANFQGGLSGGPHVRMSDPAFQQRRGYGSGGMGASSEESWQERRERWLRQLDKSKAKAQVRKQAWDDGLRSFDDSSSHTETSQHPPLFTPKVSRGVPAATTPLPASDALHSRAGANPRTQANDSRRFGNGVQGWEGSSGVRAKVERKVPVAGRFAVDGVSGLDSVRARRGVSEESSVSSEGAEMTSQSTGGASEEDDVSNSVSNRSSKPSSRGASRKVPLTGAFADNRRVGTDHSGVDGTGDLDTEEGGSLPGASADVRDLLEKEKALHELFAKQTEEGPIGRAVNEGVLRQRRDTNRSQEEVNVRFESGKVGNERAWSRDLPAPLFGGGYQRPLEKENVADVHSRPDSLFQHQRPAYGRSEPSAWSASDPAPGPPSAHEQLMSTLRRLKEDGLGATNSKKVGLSFGVTSTVTMKMEGYDAVYQSRKVEAHKTSCGLSTAEELLQKLRRMRVDDSALSS